MSTLEIKTDKARAAHKKADSKGKELLENLLGKEVFSSVITDRIKTIKDCVEACGKDYDVEFSPERTKYETPDETAYREMKFISEALNDGVDIDYSNSSQYKYYPYFKRASGRGLSFYGVYFGDSDASVGPRLSFISEALAKYAVEQFPDTYDRFFNNHKK